MFKFSDAIERELVLSLPLEINVDMRLQLSDEQKTSYLNLAPHTGYVSVWLSKMEYG